ncbi:hypothetical protein B0H14DRAFT_3876339 [Mycena olivaceomarginata]|nr:hypothetical protein B0H14DRAFT_3876339 [Mycena olivaceomarginata]
MPLFTDHHAVHINARHARSALSSCPLPANASTAAIKETPAKFSTLFLQRKLAFCANKLSKKVFKSVWIFTIYPGARREHPVTTSTFMSVSTSITPSLLVLLSVVHTPQPERIEQRHVHRCRRSVRTWPHPSSRRRLITIPTRICIDIDIDPVSGLAPILSRNTVINAVSHAGGLRSTPTGTRAVPHAASISCCPVRVMPY